MNKLLPIFTISLAVAGFAFTSITEATGTFNAGQKKTFDASLSLGYVQTSGNTDTTATTVKGDLQKETDDYRLFAGGKTIYGKNSGVTDKEETELHLRGGLFYGKWFPFWDATYYRNPFQKYDYRIATGPGIGYYFFRDPKEQIPGMYLTGSYFVQYNQDKFTDKTLKKEEYSIHNIEQRFRYRFTESLKLKQKFLYRKTTKDSKDYYVDFSISVENNLNAHLALDIEYISKYQNLPVSADVKKLDTTFSTNIKYNF